MYDPYEQAWINDHLDLYNYALALGDSEWQAELKQRFLAREKHFNSVTADLLRQDLWRMFDQINVKMLELFGELRSEQDREREAELRSKVWELKVMRVEIVRKIKSL
ncbi:hypothetical protein [Gorillibacterium timonense]|uniref:hypothetical protein n=1 Tax=Gorillibacterium timonense TaxID=1689269 RepID=UPI00071D7D80|nr:hypothetical protein [Gorillibacterium timonense]